MARCTEALLLLATAIATSGCITGHLLDAARRVEQPRSIHDATRDGDVLFVRYQALVTDDLGVPRGTVERCARVDLGPLRGRPGVTADAVPVPWLADAPTAPRAAGDVRVEQPDGPATGLLVVGDGVPPIPANAFTRLSHAPWVWPLVPFAVAVDAAVVPPLVAFAPAVILLGD